MFEGLGFSLLEPSHHFPPTAARRTDTDCTRPYRKSTQRRARSDSEALCVKMLRATSRRSDGNDGNDKHDSMP